MTVSGKTESITALAHSFGRTALFTKVNGAIVKRMGEENSWEQMALYTKVNGLTASTTAVASYSCPRVKFMQASSRTVDLCNDLGFLLLKSFNL